VRWNLPDFGPIRIERLEVFNDVREEDFLRSARAASSCSPSALLLSGGELRPLEENRYSVVARDPFLSLRSKGDRNEVILGRQRFEIRENPLSVLDGLCSMVPTSFGPAIAPFSGGAVGYMAYDLKNSIERLPTSAHDDLNLPDLFLFWPRKIEVHDRKVRKLSRLTLKPEGVTCQDFNDPEPPGDISAAGRIEAGALHSNFSRAEYLAAVDKIRDYIRRGDVYQVNLSQRFHFALKGDPFRLWLSLFDMNPAPFYAYINAGGHQVLSTSMERFLTGKAGFIETRPIKGTRRRGKTVEQDRALAADLLRSPKDDAELSMIVDLLRNDLGRVCAPKTVRVAEHKRLESYQNVHHLVSIVTGKLRPDVSPGDIIRATFPGGSITGCPKIRSMEIIDELEPNVRHVYTGAIGYLGWHRNFDWNIAIRTAIVKGETCYFSVGGGIVYDSDPEDEYRETLDKGRTLFELIERLGNTA
jgi:para-aminobenzoate synthetase component 1